MAVIAVEETQNGRTLEVHVGDSIAIELPENPTTGYRWNVLASGEPVCEAVSKTYAANGIKPGAPGLMHCELRVVTPGVARIQLALSRAGASAGERSFMLEVSALA